AFIRSPACMFYLIFLGFLKKSRQKDFFATETQRTQSLNGDECHACRRATMNSSSTQTVQMVVQGEKTIECHAEEQRWSGQARPAAESLYGAERPASGFPRLEAPIFSRLFLTLRPLCLCGEIPLRALSAVKFPLCALPPYSVVSSRFALK